MKGSQTKQARAGGFSLALGTSTVPSNREDILQLLAGQTQHEGGREGCITLFMTRDYGALAQHRCAAPRHIPARCSAQMMAAIPLASSRPRCSLCTRTDPVRALLKPRHGQYSSHPGKYPLPPSSSSLGPRLPRSGSLRGWARRDPRYSPQPWCRCSAAPAAPPAACGELPAASCGRPASTEPAPRPRRAPRLMQPSPMPLAPGQSPNPRRRDPARARGADPHLPRPRGKRGSRGRAASAGTGGHGRAARRAPLPPAPSAEAEPSRCCRPGAPGPESQKRGLLRFGRDLWR